MLKALLREKEVVYLTWADVDVKRSVLRVPSKPNTTGASKNNERDVTVPRDLINMNDAMSRTPKLVFPREGGQPDDHLLRYIEGCGEAGGTRPGELLAPQIQGHGLHQTPTAEHAPGGRDEAWGLARLGQRSTLYGSAEPRQAHGGRGGRLGIKPSFSCFRHLNTRSHL